MIKRLFVVMMLSTLLVALVAAPVFSKAPYDNRHRVAQELAKRITHYSFPQVAPKPVRWGDAPDPAATITSYPPARHSLGAAIIPEGISSPGFTVKHSYNDDQFYQSGNRQIDFRGPNPDIHFTYATGASSLPAARGQFGYNVYDPTGGGDWPRGADIGCMVQTADMDGLFVNMAVNPSGLVVLGGVDNAPGYLENHFFWQGSRHGCFWGTGSTIEPAQYKVNFLSDRLSTFLNQPRLEIQELDGDVVLHVIGAESDTTYPIPGSDDIRMITVNYFRKFGTTEAGAWQGPITIDSMNSSSVVRMTTNGSIAASRVSADVAVAYTHNHARGIIENERYDVEVYFRRSTDGGASWGPATNFTNYVRNDASPPEALSGNAFINTHSLFDSEGGYHIIFTGEPWPENVYADPTFFRGDFSGNIYHWTDRVPGPNAGGTLVKAQDANWGIAFNTQVCGLAFPGCSYAGFENLTECGGRLYLVYCQWLDARGDWGVPQIDDCASGFTDRRYAANGEICMVVSSTLDGILWDFPRNLTNSYTPGCDSAGWGGICMNDVHPTASRYGMDSTAYGEALTFPGDDLVMPALGVGQTWTGHRYFHVQYTEDHYPGPGWADRTNDNFNDQTNNPIKWMRIPCVDPIEAPQIAVRPDEVGYPNYIKHGDSAIVTVTVTNDGNVELHVTDIQTWEDTAAGVPDDWLDISATTMNVSAGVYNTGTFDIYISKDQNVNSPGTIIPLYGTVTIYSDAFRDDTLVIPIDYVAADTVIGMEWDTVSTGLVSLIVTNTAEMGFNGWGKVNLDYVANGGECNSNAQSYLYSGGPLVMRRNAADNHTLSFGMWQNQFNTDFSFRRIQPITGYPTPQSSSHLTGPNYDGYFTGTVVNSDSSIAVERTYYAPTDNAAFVITKTDIFSWDGATHSNLILGEITDWDIWSDLGTNNANNACSTLMDDYATVYVQGVDTAGATSCQPNANRFGSAMMLGYYINTEFAGDPCANTYMPYGVWANNLHTWFDSTTSALVDSLRPDYHDLWDSLKTLKGDYYNDTLDDQAQFLTFVHDYELAPTDTFTVYTVVTTVHNGDLDSLKANLEAAKAWYLTHLRSTCDSTVETFYPDSLVFGCCMAPSRGNVDYDAGGVIDIGDVTALIDFLYIRPGVVPPECPEEADVNTDEVTDIGDVTRLIDFLYIRPGVEPLDPC